MIPSSQRNEGELLLEKKVVYPHAVPNHSRSTKSYLLVKRMMDVMGAVCGLLLLSPLFAIVALLIKFEDPRGPVFFHQIRVGKNEKRFHMFKFRSMVSNAEELLEELLDQNEVSGAMFKMKNDPRITRIGKFIRKTSVDELPQLWNVIRGDMSLVGPRPPLVREVADYSSYDKQRLRVTPGCTGLWQVSGRNNVGFERMVELDIRYIDRRSITYDIRIIFKTIRMLFGDKNAF
ncbi:sugar transferase [Paenibacillus macquariensis]|uniref:Sugar transferase involved in LPS biosynthesis (Colanic, teichoic acid) n=1 Tax=Paenibacillus macquariensis TaxID=948756 RepID=A0ABY1JQU7_9BACL|nr:sugar transferase [Paenibacillus macquariensis]MEC0092639.1 sugar transferase [Paenibacillus macquariensis]SIQ62771.1 Sugar transferase involved in LPS biosynthesis (colanic, teichoic acid) [Paenibacillus macquariensis]